jgi:hypothetical protein
MVYSGDRALSNIFDESAESERAEFEDLLYDLKTISNLYGRVTLSEDAIGAFNKWREGGELPKPKHPKLTHYCTRRTAHVIKLAMVASVSRGPSLVVTLEDFEEARGWLIEAESGMPDIFLAGVTGGDSAAMDEAWWYVHASWAKQRPVVEHDLVHFIRERVPAHSVIRTLDVMLQDGTLRVTLDAKTGIKTYAPGPRKPSYG